MYDGPADQLLVPPSVSRSRSRGSSITENIGETAAVWEKAFAGYHLEQRERGKKKRSSSTTRSYRHRAASSGWQSERDGHPSARSGSLTIEPDSRIST